MNIKRALGLAFIYVGAVIGAGFASGQEIWQFIARYQIWGIPVICIISFFFIILGPLFFNMVRRCAVESYQQIFYKYFPEPLAYLLDIIFGCFLLGSVSVMIAGSGTLFFSFLGLPYFVGVIFTIVFILIIMKLKIEGIFTISSILIPFLIIITIYIVIFWFVNTDLTWERWFDLGSIKGINIGLEWIRDGLFYGAYNLVMAVAVMTNIVYKENENNVLLAGVIGGIILCILIIIIYLGLTFFYQDTSVQEIPLLNIAKNSGKRGYLLYIIALYFAMITTAVANYYAFTNRFVSLFNLGYEKSLISGLVLILPLIPSGFSKLVNNLYPVFGGLSLIICFFYLLIFYRERKR